LTCTAVAHGMLGFFLMLHPLDSNATERKNAVIQPERKCLAKT
jgi:hypothetical protein